MEQVINKRIYDLSKVGEIIQTILIVLGALLVPVLLPQLIQTIFGRTSLIANNSQIIVGSIVNTALIMAGINMKGWKNIILIATLPSLSAIGSGYIFGSLTKITVLMIPGIWLGNFSLLFLMKYLYVNKNIKYYLSSAIAILIKVAIIYTTLNIWMSLDVIPNQGTVATALKNSMGMIQLITATIGTIIADTISKVAFRNKCISEKK